MGADDTETDSGWVAVPFTASVATSEKTEVPAAVGVPAITPVVGSMVSPDGREPPATDQV